MRLEWLRAALIAVRNVAVGSNLASLRLFRQPRKLIGYHAEALFMLDAFARTRGLPERHVLDLLPQPAPVTIRLSNRTDSLWFRAVTSYLADLVGLCLLCQALRPRIVFEIGTLNGYSALHFALNTPPDATILTLDLPPGEVKLALEPTLLDRELTRYGAAATRYAFTGTEVESKIRPLKGDSATFDFSPWHRSVDLFFIDGAHSYEYVRSDSERALQCLRPGGTIAWHDFGRRGVNGVGRCVRELAAQGLDIGVVPGGSLAYVVGVRADQLR
jgi:predicted O-methyltransferase YrrM